MGTKQKPISVWNRQPARGKVKSMSLFPNNLKFQGMSEGVGLIYAPSEGWGFWPIHRLYPQMGESGAKTVMYTRHFGFVYSVQWRKAQEQAKIYVFLNLCFCLPCQQEGSCSPALATFSMTLHNIVSGSSRKKLGLISVLHWLCKMYSFIHDTCTVIHASDQAQEYLCPSHPQTGMRMDPCQEVVSA